jgi:hypothetical protein
LLSFKLNTQSVAKFVIPTETLKLQKLGFTGVVGLSVQRP